MAQKMFDGQLYKTVVGLSDSPCQAYNETVEKCYRPLVKVCGDGPIDGTGVSRIVYCMARFLGNLFPVAPLTLFP